MSLPATRFVFAAIRTGINGHVIEQTLWLAKSFGHPFAATVEPQLTATRGLHLSSNFRTLFIAKAISQERMPNGFSGDAFGYRVLQVWRLKRMFDGLANICNRQQKITTRVLFTDRFGDIVPCTRKFRERGTPSSCLKSYIFLCKL